MVLLISTMLTAKHSLTLLRRGNPDRRSPRLIQAMVFGQRIMWTALYLRDTDVPRADSAPAA